MGSDVDAARISDDVRAAAADLLRAAVARGALSLEAFERTLALAMAADREAELADLVRTHAPPVALTPPERRYGDDVVEISTKGPFANVKQAGRWQVPRHLRVRTGVAKITLDFTDAEFDAWEVDIDAGTDLGDVIIIVPRGMAVQPVRTTAPMRSDLDPPVPGFPRIRLSTSINIGKIRLRHPKRPKKSRA